MQIFVKASDYVVFWDGHRGHASLVVVDWSGYRLSAVNIVLDVEPVGVNTILSAHIDEGGNANLIVRVQRIVKLAVVLCLVISATEFADALEHGSSVFSKIGEGKRPLRPVIEVLEHIDASCNDFVNQGLIIVSIHFDSSFCFRYIE